jgi:hypothetical protein
MDVSNQREQVSVLLDQECLVTSLEQVPDAAMPPVEPLRVGRLERQHHSGQPRWTSLYRQVHMISHQAIGQYPQPEPLPAPDKPVQILLPVTIVPEDCLALVAPSYDVIDGPFRLQPQRPRHPSIIQEIHG